VITVNGRQIISKVMALCGGTNVFARLPAIAPQVDIEAVIAANPEVIIASGLGDERPRWLDDWRRYPGVAAARADRLVDIPSALLQRHTPRILDGAERVCQLLDAVRAGR
jgi:iron complex transport system substrate-binding protein